MARRLKLVAFLAAGTLGAAAFLPSIGVRAAVPLIPSSPQYSEASQIVGTLNYLIGTINNAITPQTMAQYATPRNIIDNGAMAVQQRGTGTRTCGTTTIPTTAYAADRWGCNVNVTSGAGTLQVITANLPAAPLPPFANAQVFYRTSGALAQPQCVMEEIPTSRITQTQGQNMVLSFYAQGLANMLAEQTTLNAYVFTGTGTDEGLQSFTASPAITPAFTGIASTLTKAFTITSSWAQYQYSFLMPTTATEAAVALCWTPTTGGTAGTTDGFRFTGVQLEQANSGVASAYEFRPYGDELRTAEAYYYQINETAAIFPVAPCSAVDTTHTNCIIKTPVEMVKAPALSFANGFATPTSTTQATLGACTTLQAATTVASTVGGIDSILVNCTATTIPAAGVASFLYSNNGTGIIRASADF